MFDSLAQANKIIVEPVNACVIKRDDALNLDNRIKIARCLEWHYNPGLPFCHGAYSPILLTSMPLGDDIGISADNVLLSADKPSKLSGHVEVKQHERVLNAQTAYIYRDNKSNKVIRVELLNGVKVQEPGRLLLARQATIYPQDRSGIVNDAIYRFDFNHANAILPAWGQASLVKRFPNKDYLLERATYSTCAPNDNSWRIEAQEIKVDSIEQMGIAKNAVLRVADFPVFYAPYLSFPVSNKRKSGFLMPYAGFSNVGGAEIALPYYWNIAPNYDATILPHSYTRRGMMLGGEFRFLTEQSHGEIKGNILPSDKAYKKFLRQNSYEYPILKDKSDDRWSLYLRDDTALTPDLHMHINLQRVSDDYYLQDFSTNLAVLTENQLLRQGDLVYNSDHWLLRGAVQSYQTLHPVNQSQISDIYERLPQLLAKGTYANLPLQANFNILSQYDNFRWTENNYLTPQGPRFHLNPILSFPLVKPWGYFTPSIQLVENNYDVRYIGSNSRESYNIFLPRYNVDSGLTFERQININNSLLYTQTIEPRLYYLNVPYREQTPVPVYDSAYMIFNVDQLFRANRFSGFDRISDANQLAYAVTSRFLSEVNGQEKASITLGQIKYFANRRVQLCYRGLGTCTDSPLFLGYTSPLAQTSPVAVRGVYHLNRNLSANGDFVWDTYTHATNNGNFNFHYQPAENHIITAGYTYLANGNIFKIDNNGVFDNALHQATIAYAWPFSEKWSSLGAYSYNISKQYTMLSLLGLQYDSCCWAARMVGGRSFTSLSTNSLKPQYNNNIYFQILMKGLGTVSNNNPSSTINSYLSGYRDIF